jgi:archaeosine-15-forming tRNA-guanine transglycosylase
MHLNTPPAVPVKAYLWQTEPIVRFRADDGKVYLKQFHVLRGVYDEETQTLSITTADGTIAITGPGAWEVTENLCPGRVTMIRSDGEKITSVQFTSAEPEL